jgi:membrane-bound lytic murein transglycosylase A
LSPNQRLFVVATVSALVGAAFGAGLTQRLRAPEIVVREQAADQARGVVGAMYTPVGINALPGWTQDTVGQALPALKRSCAALKSLAPDAVIGNGPIARPAAAWHAACAQIEDTQDGDANVRATLERAFAPYRVSASSGTGRETTKGMFTGYYEAELNGSLVRTGTYQIPIYGLPRNLIVANIKNFLPKQTALPSGMPEVLVGRLDPDAAGQSQRRLQPYFTREDIDNNHAIAEDADVILWADDPVAVHILHIQGSGRVNLPDGQQVRIGFAGHNGRAFRGIGSILIEAGQLQPGGASMIAVRDWLRGHPDQATEFMNRNTRYIFFRRIQTAGANDGPIGAMGVSLTAGRSIAVDQGYIPMGSPVWLDLKDPDNVELQRLVVAQDVGGAITGPVRGDYFWGHGEDAFHKAARMKSQGSYFVFIPRPVAASGT